MSELISKEEVIKALGDIHPLDYNAWAYKSKIESIPSADIMECARALLDYSKGRKCEECRFESACDNGFSCPCDWVLWDLPEGDKAE